MNKSDCSALYSLKGKVAVVIGGARDLGFDIAEVLAAAGADTVVTSRRISNAQATAAKLADVHKVNTNAYALEVTDHSDVRSVAIQIAKWRGHIDILFNNAGGGLGLIPTEFFDRPPQHVEQLIKVNLVGLLYCCQEFARPMVEQRYGKIINIASMAGLVGRDRRIYSAEGIAEQPVDYAAAKAGVLGATRDLAAVLGSYGINVNAISPGGFERGQPEEFINAYTEMTPLCRMGRDGFDLKGAALFLASSASDYVSGHNLVVDGGFSVCK